MRILRFSLMFLFDFMRKWEKSHLWDVLMGCWDWDLS